MEIMHSLPLNFKGQRPKIIIKKILFYTFLHRILRLVSVFLAVR